MSSDEIKNGEDSDMAECDGENVVTMMDVLKEQQDFEEDANAVLGASDDKNCTYSKGYVKRQAIYACMTCCPDAKTDKTKRAGLCLACSLHCHENHELVELYTKRNFRCDCGNPKFSSSCQFTPNKMDLNYENRYNQNFSGVYCTCQRPYPDPENPDEDEMIQCVVCEDWLHINHLNATVPANDQYDEMVCSDCMEDNDFLHDYSDMVINVVDKEIIVTDPDLDINESYFKKDSLVNGNSKDDEKVADKVDSTEAEPKNDKQTTEDKKEEISADVDMPETNDGDNKEVSEKVEENESAKPEGQETNAEPNKDAETNPDTKTKQSDSTAESTVDSEKQDDTSEKQDDAKDSETATNSEVVENKSDENVPEPEPKPEEMDEATKEKIEEDKLLNDEPEKPDEEKLLNDEPEKPDETDKKEITVENKDDSEKSTEEMKNDITAVTEPITNGHENKRKLSTEQALDNPSPKKAKVETQKCTRPRGVKHLYNGATFWPSDFRQRLCTCNECIAMYKDLAVLFLTDLEDTVTAYEALGKERIEGPSSQYEKGLQALSSLDRVHQINALTEYNKMKDKLLDFLKSFKDKKEIVKEEDIKAFFAGMKPKREPDGVYFCR